MGNVCCEDDNYPNVYPKTDSTLGVARKSTKSSNSKTHKQLLQLQKKEQTYEDAQKLGRSNLNGKGGQIMPKHGTENYQSIKYLGKGTFGNVLLAQDKETGKQYAMKIIEKAKIKEVNLLQCELIRKISQCQLFVKIRETFQNQTKIYIVMQYLPKGDIYYYLRKKIFQFSEDVIRVLISEIIVGIQTLHNEGIIYRELKPENIFVTNEGHIKLGDYGLSRIIDERKNPLSTFIGTLEYTAPEALNGHYDRKADIWAIGVLMYQLKFEQNLFDGMQATKVKQNIENINIEEVLNRIVGKLSYQFRDVLLKILQKDPEKRITLEQLKRHAFFNGVLWQEIIQRKNPAPLKQILQNDHIKFRNPNNYEESAHRKNIDSKNKAFEAKLYEFRDE